MNNLVSVIIPTFNRAAIIGRALCSVMEQTVSPHEIIVVDDGSTDGSRDIVSRQLPCARYIYQENGGPALARNRGLQEARGNMIAFLDSDDFWTKNKLEIQLALFDKDPALDIVSGQTQTIRDKNPPTANAVEDIGEPTHLFAYLSASLLKKSCFDRVGPFNPGLRFANDMDWAMRAREIGLKRVFHDGIVSYYLRHGSNMTLDIEQTAQEAIAALKFSLDRRRNK
jgi:glycosyltransferase involved in cell wall biosynthesis